MRMSHVPFLSLTQSSKHTCRHLIVVVALHQRLTSDVIHTRHFRGLVVVGVGAPTLGVNPPPRNARKNGVGGHIQAQDCVYFQRGRERLSLSLLEIKPESEMKGWTSTRNFLNFHASTCLAVSVPLSPPPPSFPLSKSIFSPACSAHYKTQLPSTKC